MQRKIPCVENHVNCTHLKCGYDPLWIRFHKLMWCLMSHEWAFVTNIFKKIKFVISSYRFFFSAKTITLQCQNTPNNFPALCIPVSCEVSFQERHVCIMFASKLHTTKKTKYRLCWLNRARSSWFSVYSEKLLKLNSCGGIVWPDKWEACAGNASWDKPVLIDVFYFYFCEQNKFLHFFRTTAMQFWSCFPAFFLVLK